MGTAVRRLAEITEPQIVEFPGVPEVFANGVVVRGLDRETVQIVYTVARGEGEAEAVLRVWMPRGLFETCRCRWCEGGKH